MCLIFQKEKDAKPISRAWCEDVWRRNDDGWGIAYQRPSNSRMTVKTGMKFEDFWNTFSSLQRLPIDIVVHMRMATQGEVSEANAHPFLLSERHNIWFMHNGCVDYPEAGGSMDDGFVSMENLCDLDPLDAYESMFTGYGREHVGYGGWGSGPSDTFLLASRLLKPMLNNMVNASEFIRSEGFAFLMEKVGGSDSNKFTFHDDEGHILLNRYKWDETTTGIPVSNTYAFSLDKKPIVGYTGTGGKRQVS
jgi:hypothetical protein